jgi:ribosomal protein L40E
MALIDCKECGKKISTEATWCPHRGPSKPVDRPSGLLVCRECGLVVLRDAASCRHCGVPNPLGKSKSTKTKVSDGTFGGLFKHPEIAKQHAARAQKSLDQYQWPNVRDAWFDALAADSENNHQIRNQAR